MAMIPEEKSGGRLISGHDLKPDLESAPTASHDPFLSSHPDHGEASPARPDADEMEKKVKVLFEAQKFAVLATHASGAPYGNLVAFASSEDLCSLLFVTSRATRKYRNLSADSQVAMVMDNRSNEVRDFGEAIAVTALGRALEVQEPEKSCLLGLYLEKHPNLNEFALSPSCALFGTAVEKYIIVSRFQNVTELWPTK